ncbi:MAG: hydrogenase small subunit [Candidatus Aminicenantes bacterium]|nr:hydrogenase small subunit [Candidatus Aminicenantes bacterium]
MPDKTIYQQLREDGLSRRDFVKFCGLLSGMIGLEFSAAGKALGAAAGRAPADVVAQALKTKPRLPVIWLELQDCAGCTEAISRSTSPSLSNLVLNRIAIDYQETLMAAAGAQAEEAKRATMAKYRGQYVLVVEGSPTVFQGGAFCTIGGRSNLEILKEAAEGAAAVIATGNCAAFGGLPRAHPNPTGAHAVMDIITDKPVINIPGCPAIPDVTTGVIVHFLVLGTLPKTDGLKRPLAFYGHTIHDHCLRRPFHEAGRFAADFGGRSAREGWCLYKLGCKGPTTYNACSSLKWERGLSFPVQSGHPCLGCSEPKFWDGGGFYQGQSAPLNRPGKVDVGLAVGAGAILGGALAVANRAGKKRGVAKSEAVPPKGKAE